MDSAFLRYPLETNARLFGRLGGGRFVGEKGEGFSYPLYLARVEENLDVAAHSEAGRSSTETSAARERSCCQQHLRAQ